MATLAALEKKIEDLPDDAFQVFTASKTPPTEDEVDAIEAKTGIAVPKALRAFLLRYGVLVVEVKPEVWPRPKEFDVLPAWQFEYGVRVLGAGKNVPEELRIEAAVTDATKKAAVVPYFQRIGAKWLGVFGEKVVGTWAADGFEADEGDVIDAMLREIAALENGVARLRAGSADIEALMEIGRNAKWQGPKASDVVDALKKQPKEALAPRLPELAKTLLPAGTFSMGCLDIIQAAGAEAFPSVAEMVYAHDGDAPYVLALLEALKISDEKAIALYRTGLESNDDDTVEAAIAAIGALGPKLGVPLLGAVEARVDTLEDDSARSKLIGLLGQLGSRQFAPLVLEAVEKLDDGGFTALLRAIRGAPKSELEKLRASLEARFAKIAPTDRQALEGVEALTAMGFGDPKTMRPIAETFEKKGGRWADRAKKLFAAWG